MRPFHSFQKSVHLYKNMLFNKHTILCAVLSTFRPDSTQTNGAILVLVSDALKRTQLVLLYGFTKSKNENKCSMLEADVGSFESLFV